LRKNEEENRYRKVSLSGRNLDDNVTVDGRKRRFFPVPIKARSITVNPDRGKN
jgi:hypothetical protein